MNIEVMVNALTKDTDKKFKFTFPNRKVAKNTCSTIRSQFGGYNAVLEMLGIEGKLAIRFSEQNEDGSLIYIFGIFPKEKEPKFTIEEL